MIARAICFDDDGFFYFVRAERDDDFGKATLIETSGGAMAGEDLQSAIKRELKEELGVEVDVVRKIGVVSDYYNLIHRHNLNNYLLCKVKPFGDKNLMQRKCEGKNKCRYDSRFALPVYADNGEVERYNVYHASMLIRHANDGKM